jgi:hypothetical protein
LYGDVDHLKVFASKEVANAWFAKHDAEGCGIRILTVHRCHRSSFDSTVAMKRYRALFCAK